MLSSQEMYDRLLEDTTLEHLQIDVPALLDHPVVLRFRLCGASDDIVADWNESEDHDGELEVGSAHRNTIMSNAAPLRRAQTDQFSCQLAPHSC